MRLTGPSVWPRAWRRRCRSANSFTASTPLARRPPSATGPGFRPRRWRTFWRPAAISVRTNFARATARCSTNSCPRSDTLARSSGAYASSHSFAAAEFPRFAPRPAARRGSSHGSDGIASERETRRGACNLGRRLRWAALSERPPGNFRARLLRDDPRRLAAQHELLDFSGRGLGQIGHERHPLRDLEMGEVVARVLA